MNLSSRVISGTIWALGVRYLVKGMSAVQLFILARILVPQDFGLFAVASLTLVAFDVLTRTGFNDALIYKRGNIDLYLHTAFWIQVARGVVLAALIFFAAPYIAILFDDPAIAPVVATLALVQVLRGLRSLGVVLLEREINFRTESMYQAAGNVVTIVTTLVLVWQLQNVWALVYGTIAGETALLILSYFVHPYRPRWTFNFAKATELIQFGIWLFLSGLVSYVSLQADSIAVGKLLSIEALGAYYIAYKLANLFVTEIAKPLGKVLKPAYAAVQNNPERLRVGLESTVAIFLATFLPFAVFLMLATPLIVPVLLGGKWEPIIPILPVLALGALFRALGTTAGPFFVGTGKPKLVFYVELTRALALLVSLYPCFLVVGGMLGIAWASTLSTATLLFFVLTRFMPIMQIRLFVTRDVMPIVLSTTFAGAVVLFELFTLPYTWSNLLLIVLTYTTLYVGFLWKFVDSRAHLTEVKALVTAHLKHVSRG